MKVALLNEPMWLAQEVTMLQRLTVALMDEQVRMVPIVPTPFDAEQSDLSMSASVLRYEPTGWRWLRDWRIGRLRPELEDLDVDVIHATSAPMERPAVRLGEELGVPVVCSVWSIGGAIGLEGTGAPGASGPSATSGALADRPPTVYAAATPAIADQVRAQFPGARVELLRPGVYCGADQPGAPPLGQADRPPTFLVIGDGRADAAYQALLEGMAKAKSRLDGAMYFFYAVGSEQHNLWKAAEALGLQEQVSWVPVGGPVRDLLVQADVVVLPQPAGVVRSVVLEAMRAARPVLAAPDSALDYLIPDQTARVLDQPTATDWANALLWTTTEPQKLVDLGSSASRYVRDTYGAAKFAETLLALYRTLAPQAIPFVK